MRVVILGNGPWENPKRLLELLKPGDFLLACDGAYKKAVAVGLKPQAVIGDFDSMALRNVPAGVEVVKHPSEKDETDGELALALALAKKPKEILWYAALGDRWDHTLANLFLLVQAASRRVPVHLLQGDWELFLVLDSLVIQGKTKDRVSLIPLSKQTFGVSTQGLKYALSNQTLFLHKSRGVSNEMKTSKASVSLKRGWLLVLHEYGKR